MSMSLPSGLSLIWLGPKNKRGCRRYFNGDTYEEAFSKAVQFLKENGGRFTRGSFENYQLKGRKRFAKLTDKELKQLEMA